MQTRNNADPTSDGAIRERLNQLAAGTPQAEIARKAGVTRSNVSRYLKDTRIPAEFCAKAVQTLGANPAWLLVGEGSARLSEVGEPTVRMAGNLLELVGAMNEVARMRLGSLTGKHHLKVLRELDDALKQYERLRATLNEASRPFYRQILDDLTRAIARRDVERAEELRKAVSQVARLGAHEELDAEFEQQQAHLEYLLGHSEHALELQRRVFARELRQGAISESGCRLAFNLTVTLAENGRHREALRVSGAALALAAENANTNDYHALRIAHGRMLLENGHLRQAMAVMQSSFGKLEGRAREAASGSMLLGLLLSRTLEPAEAQSAITHSPSATASDLRYALWTEQPKVLQAALSRAGASRVSPLLLETANAALDALTGRKVRELPAASHGAAAAKAPAAIWRCKLERLNGGNAVAQFKEAETLLRVLPAGVSVDWLMQAEHARNALRLLKPAPDHAKKFFPKAARRGYLGVAAQ